MPGIDFRDLKQELSKPEYDDKTDAEAAAILNAPGVERVGIISAPALVTWGAKSGVRAKIRDGTTHAVAAVRAMCLAVEDQLVSGRPLDVTSPDVQLLVDAMVVAGIMTTAEKTSLLAVAMSPGPSWADRNWGGHPVTSNDVHVARRLP